MGKRRQATARRFDRLKTLFASERGSVYAMMAAALIPTIGVVGSGVDLGRAYMADSRLQSAVDAAVMAGVRAQQLDPATGAGSPTWNAIYDYLNANISPTYLGMTRQSPNISVVKNGTSITVAVTVQARVPTTLMKIFGFSTLPIAAAATAEAGETLPAAVEALLVLDNTGSMEGTRMTQLKDAAKSFVDVVYGTSETRTNFAIGMLPYNTMVNVGRLVMNTKPAMIEEVPGFTDVAATNRYGWKGCVQADPTKVGLSTDINTIDSGTFDMGSNMPGDGGMPKIKPFLYPSIYVNSFQDLSNQYKFGSTTANEAAVANYKPMRDALVRFYGTGICVHKTSGVNLACDQTDSVVSVSKITNYSTWPAPKFYTHKSGTNNSKNGPSPNYQCPSEALPVQYNRTKTALKTYITDENAALNPGTGTFHNPAMTWAFRMMTRLDVFPRTAPADIPVRRVVIFMTDGNFDSQDDGRKVCDSNGKNCKTIYDTAYTAYNSYEDKLVTTTPTKAATVPELSKRYSKTCQAMKAAGLEIYTIAFALDNNAQGNATREMFKTCATDRNTHFFSVATGAELKTAFQTIAAELVDLHLSK
jgi:Flp pilus assembly protein TadG